MKRARLLEIWAARAWNVFNEGRPFSVVYPAMVLLAAAPLGLGPDGPLWLALLGALAVSLVLMRFPFPLRGRALLWLALAASVPLLEPWRDPALLAGALAGWAVFTVLVWGSVYYHLRTGAPWTNFTRFWRLVLTNSDPTSGNAGEQVPKFLMALSAGVLLAEEGAGSSEQVAAVALLSAAFGAIAWHRFKRRLPEYPPALCSLLSASSSPAPCSLLPAPSRRVYVIVIDGLNRRRLWQARTPVMDRLAREGTEYLAVDPAYPARTVVCFSSMLTGASPAEHGMRSNFVPRLGVRTDSVFGALERAGKKGRLVGIAHLLDPFGENVVRSVTSVQPTERLDHSLSAAARAVVDEEDPDLLVVQLLAADQLGHVRGVRNPDYLGQVEETDRRVGELLEFLRERGGLEGATVILMADHGQGRGIGGHGHLDWGERPVPFVVWGAGAVPGAVSREPHNVVELAQTVSALLGVEPPRGARGRPLVPVLDAGVDRVPRGGRVLVRGAGDEPLPEVACGMTVERAGSREQGVGDVEVVLGSVEDLEPLVDPIARGRADRVVGIRSRRPLADRALNSVLGALDGGAVYFDAASPYRAWSHRPRGGETIEVPVAAAYPARASWRRSFATRRATTAAPTTPASTNGYTAPASNSGNASTSGPHGASGRPTTSPPAPSRTSA